MSNHSELVSQALTEDSTQNDVTTAALELGTKFGRAQIIAKEDLILSGCALVEETFKQCSSDIEIKWQFKNGDPILKQQVIALLSGPLEKILNGERVALNFMGHMCGIATLTHCYVKAVENTGTKILDTRKTHPNLRNLEKQAVIDGGGSNHRMSLSEAILIKENHIRSVGGLKLALQQAKKNSQLPIEVEITNLNELKEALNFEIHRVLLDNMSNEVTELALKMIPSHIETEASGNMSIDRIRSVAELGVDFISVGALTHSAPCADLSLMVNEP